MEHSNNLVRLPLVFSLELSDSYEGGNLIIKKSYYYWSIVPLLDWPAPTYSRDSRVLKLHNLHDAMYQILQPLSLPSHRVFVVQFFTPLWSCHYVIASHCCNIPEGKDMVRETCPFKYEMLDGKEVIAALFEGATPVHAKLSAHMMLRKDQ